MSESFRFGPGAVNRAGDSLSMPSRRPASILFVRMGRVVPSWAAGAFYLLESPEFASPLALGVDLGKVADSIHADVWERVRKAAMDYGAALQTAGFKIRGYRPSASASPAQVASFVRGNMPRVGRAFPDAATAQKVLMALLIEASYHQDQPQASEYALAFGKANFRPGVHPVLAEGGGGKSSFLRAVAHQSMVPRVHIGESDPGEAAPLPIIEKWSADMDSALIIDSLVDVSSYYAETIKGVGTGKGGEPLGHLSWTYAAARAAALAGVAILAAYPPFDLSESVMRLLRVRAVGLITTTSINGRSGTFTHEQRGGAREPVTYEWSAS